MKFKDYILPAVLVLAIASGMGLMVPRIQMEASAQEPSCGDTICEEMYEDCSSCPSDCGACAYCGDASCDDMEGEDCSTCPGDCGACYTCGDYMCDEMYEDCSSCPSDCGACAYCGDASCDDMEGEDCSTCPGDCGACEESCGDMSCDIGEECSIDCSIETHCSDLTDNDQDTFIDCDDSDCSSHPSCPPPAEEICNNFIDDDGDLMTDCMDTDCISYPVCVPPEICDNGNDDDSDGTIDCNDTDCAVHQACTGGDDPPPPPPPPPGEPEQPQPPDEEVTQDPPPAIPDEVFEQVTIITPPIQAVPEVVDKVEEVLPEITSYFSEHKNELNLDDQQLQALRDIQKIGEQEMTASEKASVQRIVKEFTIKAVDKVKEDSLDVREHLVFDFLQDENIQSVLVDGPQFANFVSATTKGDLATAAELLPLPKWNVPQSLSKIHDIEESFPELFVKQKKKSLWGFYIFQKVFADHEESINSVDPRDEFKKSVNLMKEMEDISVAPETTLPVLDNRLAYLSAREQTLGGAEDLSNIRTSLKAGENETNNLQGLRGLMSNIRSKANFKDLENALSDAAVRMHSGIEHISSIFKLDVAPSAEAAQILVDGGNENAVTVLRQSANFVAQKALIEDILDKLDGDINNLLDKVDENERIEFQKRMEEEKEKLRNAESMSDIRESMRDVSSLIRDVQSSARNNQNFLLRMAYAFRDFFGLNKLTYTSNT